MKRKKNVGTKHSEKVIVLMRTAALKSRLLSLYTPKQADQWMHAPQRLLEGSRPIDLLSNTSGYLEVDNVIDRLLNDIYL